jgi:hypothetical protein
MGFDRKYGRVTTEHGDIPDDEPVIVFRGRDPEAPAMLEFYLGRCAGHGSPQRHLDLVGQARDLIAQWQRDHPDRVKQPDSERSRAWLGGRTPWPQL